MPYQNVLLWHVDGFKLKAIKTQQTQKKPLTYPLTIKKNFDRGGFQEERYSQRLISMACIQTFVY